MKTISKATQRKMAVEHLNKTRNDFEKMGCYKSQLILFGELIGACRAYHNAGVITWDERVQYTTPTGVSTYD